MKNIPFISPYNDIDIIAGQGTVGVETLEQLPRVDVVFACIGGGGLISGVAAYLKEKSKRVKIIGCEPLHSCQMSASVRAGKLVEVEHKETLAEGSAGGIEPGSITFGFCKKYVDEYMQATESEIRDAMVYMIEKQHKVAEGAAVVPLACLMKNKAQFEGKNIVVVISGSGVGIETIRSVLL